jgi:T1SS-143 domain-containing protein
MDMRTQIIDKTVVVSSVEGNVQILLADGSSRPLQPGEILQPGARLNIADDAKLMLAPYDDKPAEGNGVPAGTEMPPEGQSSSSVANHQQGSPEVSPEIAALQQSILQGVDPTKNFEASAAGGAPAAGGGGGIGGVAGASGNGGFVVIDRIGDATIAEAGFDTGYDTLIDQNVLQEDDLLPENQLDDQDESAVTQEDQAISGNVLDNSNNPDGPLDTSVISYSWGSNQGIAAGVESTLDGIGTLIINADGSYTFTSALNYTGPVPAVNYTVTDGDDTNDSTLTITITPVDEPVSLNGLQVEGGELVLEEAALPDGSAPDGAALTKSSTFTFNAADGVQSLTLGGVTLISNGQVLTTFPQGIPSPLGNQLLVTGVSYNPVTGVGSVTYSYTLNDNETHNKPANDGALTESFNVVLTDLDGDTTSAGLDVVVLDDVPTAVSDVNLTVASENNLVLNGNVITNDVQGADGAAVTAGTLSGTYGSLVLNANGTYTYTLNPNDGDFKALTGGGVGSEVFTYTLTDADGDVSTATLTLTIKNDDDGVTITNLTPKGEGGDAKVYEDDLLATRGANESAGSDSSKESTTVTGDFTISAPDGVKTLSVGGINIVVNGVVAGFPLSGVTTPLGNTLTITGYNPATGLVSYSYTLNDNEAHPTANGNNSLFEDFAVSLVDSDGDSASNTLSVQIVDDVPTAVSDVNLTAASENNLVLNGNVITNDVQGADGAAVTAGTLSGTYGSLVLNANGTYTYTLNPNDGDFKALTGGGVGSEVFTYTLTDADGDVSTATLTLTIKNDDDGVTITNLTPKGEGGDAKVYEDDLLATRGANESAGSDSSKESTTVTGDFTISAPDGVKTLSVGGINIVVNGVVAGFPLSGVTTPLGNTLTITGYNPATGLVSYSYTLNDNEAHPTANGNNSLFEDFAVSLVDSDGDSASNTLSVQIVDDVPTAKDNSVTVTEAGLPPFNLVLVIDTSGSMLWKIGTTTNGSPNRLELAKSALNHMIDSYVALGVPLTITVIDFASGALLIPQTSDPDVAKASISGLPTDGGGTNYNAPLVLAQNQLTADLANPALAGYETKVYFLSDGAPNEGNVPAGWTSFVNNNNVEVYAVGLNVSGNASAISQLALVEDNGDTVTLVDNINDLDATLQATVPPPATGNVITDVDGSAGVDVAGADGPVTVVQISFTVTNPAVYAGVADSINGNVVTFLVQGGTTGPIPTPAGGRLTVNADGSYSYSPPNDVAAHTQEVFTYTIVDSDGDTSSAQLKILVLDTSPIVASVFEDGLPTGLPGNNPLLTTVSGSLAQMVADSVGVSFGMGSTAGLPALTSGGVAITYSITHGAGVDTLVAMAGSKPIFTLQVESDGDYTFTLQGSIDHPQGDGNDLEQKALNLSSVISAHEGVDNVALIRNFIVQVEDDVPFVMTPAMGVMLNQSGVTGTFLLDGDGTLSNNYGADGGSIRFDSALNGSNSGLTSGGLPITYSLSSNGTVLTAATAAGTVFIATLQPASATYQVYDDIKIYEQGVALGTDPIMNTVPPANSGEGNTQVFNLIPVGTTVNSAWVSTSYVYDTTTAAVTGNWQSTDTPLYQNITIRELDGFVPAA